MTKNKPQINFYGKSMNLLEAKLFSLGLRVGAIEIILTEGDLEEYTKWKSIRENRNELSKRLVKEETYKRLTERDYLIECLEGRITSTKFERKKIYCARHGHKEKKGSAYTPLGGTVTHYTCLRCGTIYKEEENFLRENSNEKIDNPFRG